MPANQLIQTTAPVLLLEREAELAALEAMLGAAQSGDGRLVVVEGSAGIGKTRLLAEARALAAAAEFEVLTARGGELEGEFAFGIVRQLFEAPLAAATPELRAELLAGAAELSASLFASAPTSASGEARSPRSRCCTASTGWPRTSPRARRRCSSSTTCIGPMSRRCAGSSTSPVGSRGCPVAARRDAATCAGQHAGARDGTTRRSRRGCDPSGRPRSGIGSDARPRALGSRAGRGLQRSAADGLGRESALPRCAARCALAGRDQRRPRSRRRVCSSSGRRRSLAASQLAWPACTHDATGLLRAAAILGDRTELSLAAALADLDPKAALTAASALVSADLLRHENPLEFTHPVVRTAVLEDMSADERTRAHHRAAEILLERGARSGAGGDVSRPDHSRRRSVCDRDPSSCGQLARWRKGRRTRRSRICAARSRNRPRSKNAAISSASWASQR